MTGGAFLGWARAQLGGAGEGVALIRQGLAGLAEAGARGWITDQLTRLTEAQALECTSLYRRNVFNLARRSTNTHQEGIYSQ
jgi:hypothetical protein